MQYDAEDVALSQRIFAYLLEHHELHDGLDAELYTAYTDSDLIQLLVQEQGKYFALNIDRYDNVIYIMPEEDNVFLGFSKTELKQILCRSNTTDQDYYLALFSIMVLILNFYDGYGNSCKIRDYIRFGDLQNSIADYLKKGTNSFDEDEQNESGLLFKAMSQAYESLKSDDKMSRRKTTKEGFLYAIIKFLQDQNLVVYIEQDEMIKTTRKFDHFMDWNLLDKNNYDRIRLVMKDLQNEQN
ncbi:MAG: hypothetical protein J5803_03465 [Desulfovibrio sp.]|nr:hypothetical protein [Desulfovibrio sp.]